MGEPAHLGPPPTHGLCHFLAPAFRLPFIHNSIHSEVYAQLAMLQATVNSAAARAAAPLHWSTLGALVRERRVSRSMLSGRLPAAHCLPLAPSSNTLVLSRGLSSFNPDCGRPLGEPPKPRRL